MGVLWFGYERYSQRSSCLNLVPSCGATWEGCGPFRRWRLSEGSVTEVGLMFYRSVPRPVHSLLLDCKCNMASLLHLTLTPILFQPPCLFILLPSLPCVVSCLAGTRSQRNLPSLRGFGQVFWPNQRKWTETDRRMCRHGPGWGFDQISCGTWNEKHWLAEEQSYWLVSDISKRMWQSY